MELSNLENDNKFNLIKSINSILDLITNTIVINYFQGNKKKYK